MVLLEYVRRTRFPTRRGNVRVRVDDDGGVYLQRNDGDTPQGQEWTADYPATPQGCIAEPQKRLRKLLQGQGFFDLPPLLQNPAATDGMHEKLSYFGEGGPRTVEADRIRDKAFQKLIHKLLSELGVSDQVG